MDKPEKLRVREEYGVFFDDTGRKRMRVEQPVHSVLGEVVDEELVAPTALPLDQNGKETVSAQIQVSQKKRAFSIRRLASSRKPLEVAWVTANLPKKEIRRIEAVATEVFGSQELGQTWLEQPNLATYNRSPISLLGTEGGYDHVLTLLRRIEHGMLA